MCSLLIIDNEEIPMVEQYRYLGCVVDKHLELKSIWWKRELWWVRGPWVLGFIGVGQS